MCSINPALLKKYDVYGPRYTSYPTALQFSHAIDKDDYYWHIDDSNQDPIPKSVSLYLHLPFCHSLCYYCGCHKIVTNNPTKTLDYLQLLKQEIQLQASLLSKDRPVRQIHLGGGTPTYYSTDDLSGLLDAIRHSFTVSDDCEIAIEIDPRTTSVNDIKTLVNMGFNRMSFGVQDFDHNVQSAINRIQGPKETIELLEASRIAGIHSISVDLIYGLPRQTPHSFQKTINHILKSRPNRIALYNYAHMPHRIKSQKLINTRELPETEEKLKLMSNAIEQLINAGYCHIGMDHFALPEDTLAQSLKDGSLQRNFQGYSTHSDCDIIGMGISAISKVGDMYGQNVKDIKSYQTAISQQTVSIEKGYLLTFEDHLRNKVIHDIMCRQTIDFEDYQKSHKINFADYFYTELGKLQPLVDDQLLAVSENNLVISTTGRLFLRNIAMIFDKYLSQPKTDYQEITFSKVL